MRRRDAESGSAWTPPAGLMLAGGALSVVALLALALVFADVVRLGKSNPTARKGGAAQKIAGPPATPFELRYPAGWRKVPKRELQTSEGETPVAAIRRADGRGFVTLTVRGPLAKPLDDMREDFNRVLAERFPDFELVTSSTIEVDAGPAMYTSYVLREKGQVQGNLTVPVGETSYTLDAIIPTGATDVAREVGAIFGSFQVLAQQQPGA